MEHVISGTIKLVTLPADDLQRYTFGMGFVLLLIRHSASSPDRIINKWYTSVQHTSLGGKEARH